MSHGMMSVGLPRKAFDGQTRSIQRWLIESCHLHTHFNTFTDENRVEFTTLSLRFTVATGGRCSVHDIVLLYRTCRLLSTIDLLVKPYILLSCLFPPSSRSSTHVFFSVFSMEENSTHRTDIRCMLFSFIRVVVFLVC